MKGRAPSASTNAPDSQLPQEGRAGAHSSHVSGEEFQRTSIILREATLQNLSDNNSITERKVPDAGNLRPKTVASIREMPSKIIPTKQFKLVFLFNGFVSDFRLGPIHYLPYSKSVAWIRDSSSSSSSAPCWRLYFRRGLYAS